MPYLKKPPLKRPDGVVFQGFSSRWPDLHFSTVGLPPAVAITVIHSSLGIHFENVFSTKKGLQSTCLP